MFGTKPSSRDANRSLTFRTRASIGSGYHEAMEPHLSPRTELCVTSAYKHEGSPLLTLQPAVRWEKLNWHQPSDGTGSCPGIQRPPLPADFTSTTNPVFWLQQSQPEMEKLLEPTHPSHRRIKNWSLQMGDFVKTSAAVGSSAPSPAAPHHHQEPNVPHQRGDRLLSHLEK